MHRHPPDSLPFGRTTYLAHVLANTYAALFILVYLNYLVPVWGYWGFSLHADWFTAMPACFVCINMPMLFNFKQVALPSTLVWWHLYSWFYIPAILSSALIGGNSSLHATVRILLCLSFICLAMVPRFIAGRLDEAVRGLHRADVKQVSLAYLQLVALSLILFVGITNIRILNFASLDEIYAQREQAIESFGLGSRYAVLWLTYLIGPLLLAQGFTSRSVSSIAIAALGFLVVYATSAAKVVVPIAGLCVYMAQITRTRSSVRVEYLLVVPMICCLTTLFFLNNERVLDSKIVSIFVSQLSMRSLGIQAMLLTAYAEYFANNPTTYGTHLSIVNWMFDYPYELPLGNVVGEYLSGRQDRGANSSMWATDGLAGFGVAGLVPVGVVSGIYLGLLDRFSRTVSFNAIAVATVPVPMALANVSLFTALLSGGLMFLIPCLPLLGNIKAKAFRPEKRFLRLRSDET